MAHQYIYQPVPEHLVGKPVVRNAWEHPDPPPKPKEQAPIHRPQYALACVTYPLAYPAFYPIVTFLFHSSAIRNHFANTTSQAAPAMAYYPTQPAQYAIAAPAAPTPQLQYFPGYRTAPGGNGAAAPAAQDGGANNPWTTVSQTPTAQSTYWVKELDNTYTQRSVDTIYNELKPGHWAFHRTTGYPYWVRDRA